MNHPEEREERTNQAPVEQDQTVEQADTKQEQTTPPQAVPPVEIDIFSPQQPRAQWASADWQGGYREQGRTPAGAGRAPKKRIALIAVALALCVLLSALAGYGGAMLYGKLNAALPPESIAGSPNGDPTSSNSGTGLGGQVFSAAGNAGYDYAGVQIAKNDGTALVGSVNGSAGDAAMSKIDAVAAVKASVVEITTTVISNHDTVQAGAGSGVIIHADGIIVTNNHVIEGASKVYVRLTNGNTYEATVRGTDEDGDIAVIKIDPQESLTVARLGCSAALVEGEEVLAIGNPLGELGGTVTDGIISRVQREISVDGVSMTLLQTNAAINAGNSGGGLFNLAGELIGVVNAKYSATGVEGLGFAIPVDTAILSVNRLLKLGYIPDIPTLGLTLAEGTVRSGFFFKQVVYVYDAGENDDFKYQDIIISVDGIKVSSLSEVKQIERAHSVGDRVTVMISRSGVEVELEVILVEYIPS
ncbi:MAG: trypsin-like peptidase domain-containing protein [Clostridia bacterium]|nr:trypsin-like peptidase domain-containing protein [Clostridia bacterium]